MVELFVEADLVSKADKTVEDKRMVLMRLVFVVGKRNANSIK